MNAVMRLNQYKRGLEYRLTSQTGPVHEPVFTMVVDVNGKSYEAAGPSKKAAKLNVATKAGLVLVFPLFPVPGATKSKARAADPVVLDPRLSFNVATFGHVQVLLDLGLPTGSEMKSESVAEAESQSDDSTVPASTASENVPSLALWPIISPPKWTFALEGR